MHWLKFLTRGAGMAVVLALLGHATQATAADNNPRRDWYKKYDYNDDKRLKGKEAKHFMKEHEAKHAELMKWCERALEKPAKHDVNFPKDVKAKKFKCKKKRFDEPYIKAWVKAGAPEKKEPLKHPSEKEKTKE